MSQFSSLVCNRVTEPKVSKLPGDRYSNVPTWVWVRRLPYYSGPRSTTYHSWGLQREKKVENHWSKDQSIASVFISCKTRLIKFEYNFFVESSSCPKQKLQFYDLRWVFSLNDHTIRSLFFTPAANPIKLIFLFLCK